MNELNNDKNFTSKIKDWINSNPGTAAGIIIGLLLGIFFFTIGFFKTILLLIFMFIGYVLGRSRDEDGSFLDQISKIFRGGDK